MNTHREADMAWTLGANDYCLPVCCDFTGILISVRMVHINERSHLAIVQNKVKAPGNGIEWAKGICSIKEVCLVGKKCNKGGSGKVHGDFSGWDKDKKGELENGDPIEELHTVCLAWSSTFLLQYTVFTTVYLLLKTDLLLETDTIASWRERRPEAGSHVLTHLELKWPWDMAQRALAQSAQTHTELVGTL